MYGLRGDNHARNLFPIVPAPKGQNFTGGHAQRPARGETAADVFGITVPCVNALEGNVWVHIGPSYLVNPLFRFTIRDDIAIVVEYGFSGRDEVDHLVDGFEGFFDSRHDKEGFEGEGQAGCLTLTKQ